MDRELVEKFIEVTGEGEATASQYLALADGNLDTAITLLFEAGGSSAPSPTSSSNDRQQQRQQQQHRSPVVRIDDDVVEYDDEPEIRAPILPTQEVLVPPDVTCAFPRASNSIFDRFRDFAVETRRQEEELMQHTSGGNRRTTRSNKTKRLEDLFRPPCDILFLGTFNEAREYAKSINRWLLVNVQNQQEFACQILNRDVWTNKQIKEIVNDHFVLWQVLSNASDGTRYIDFYNVDAYPYLAIIDPRTGECMQTFNHITVDTLISGLNDMLSNHASPDNVDYSPVRKKTTGASAAATATATSEAAAEGSGSACGMMAEKAQIEDAANSNIPSHSKRFRAQEKNGASSSSDSDMKDAKPSTTTTSSSSSSITANAAAKSNFISKRSKVEERESEEEERRMRGEKQRSESPADDDDNDDDEDEDDEDEEDEVAAGPTIKVCLRLPNGSKETITIGASNTVEGFIRRMEKMGYDSSEHTYLVPFPKTNIGELSRTQQLSETILYPANTVFITKI